MSGINEKAAAAAREKPSASANSAYKQANGGIGGGINIGVSISIWRGGSMTGGVAGWSGSSS